VLALEVDIHHDGCPTTETSERFPETRSEVLSASVEADLSTSVIVSVRGVGPQSSTGFLRFWRDHPRVRRFALISRRDRYAMFRASVTPQKRWISQIVPDCGALYSLPVRAEHGLETWSILMPDSRQKTNMIGKLAKLGSVKVRNAREVDGRVSHSICPSPLAGLSPRRREILQLAFDSGYFEYPHKVGSRELASCLGIAQSTFLEHLRVSQHRLLRNVLSGAQDGGSSS